MGTSFGSQQEAVNYVTKQFDEAHPNIADYSLKKVLTHVGEFFTDAVPYSTRVIIERHYENKWMRS